MKLFSRMTVAAAALAAVAVGTRPAAAVDLTMYYPVAVGGPVTKIIDDMVAFNGVEPTYIAEDRANHAACYQAYDATDAQSTAEMVGVNGDLVECIHKEMAPLLDATAQTQVENDASFGPLAAAKTRLTAAVDAHTDQLSAFCGAIAEAGENGIGTLTRVSAAVCVVRVTEHAFATLKQ